MAFLPEFQLPFGNFATITALGSNQGTAAVLTGNKNVLVSSGTGGVIISPNVLAGQQAVISNGTSAAVNIYPISGAQINSLGSNVAYSLPANWTVTITCSSPTQFYSSQLSYGIGNVRTDVASATSTPIGGAASTYVRITGTTTITSFDTVDAGVEREVLFGGSLTLTYNGTSLILPTSANISTLAGDTALFKSEGSGNWRCLWYNRTTGVALASSSGNTTGTVSAAGTTQAGATVLTANLSAVTSATALQGVALPVAAVNSVYTVKNYTAAFIYVYPVNGGSAAINGLTANAPYLIPPYGSATFLATSSTQWYTSNAVQDTDWASYGPLTIGATTTPPTKGTTTTDKAYWRKIGDSMQIRYVYYQTGAGSSGSGTYLFPILSPSTWAIDTAKVDLNTAGWNGATVGVATYGQSTANTYVGAVIPYNATNLALYWDQSGSAVFASSVGVGLATSPLSYAFEATVPIVGWSAQ